MKDYSLADRISPNPAKEPAPWQVDEAVRAEFRGLYAQWRSALPQSSVVGVCGWLGTEGISEVAARLACAAAETGLTVTLADLNPTTPASQIFELRESGVRSGDIVSWPTGFPALTVAEPAEEAGWPVVPPVLASCKRAGGAAVVALPALSTSSVAPELAPSLDGTLLVVESEGTRREDVHKAIALLRRLPPVFLGVVLNREKQYLPRLIRRAPDSRV